LREISHSEIEVDFSKSAHAFGANTDVYKCQWMSNTVALKRLRFKVKMKDIQMEAALAFQLRHPNIVTVFGTTRLENDFMGIVMEFSDLGPLDQNMEGMLLEEKIRSSICICDGLSYLHSIRVAHRDLKPQNILLFGNKSTAKISDFGTSAVIQTIQTITNPTGTPKYSAFELMTSGLKYGTSADIYSLLVILYELFSGLEAFPGKNFMMIYKAKEIREEPELLENFPPKLNPLIRKGWTAEPKDRPALMEIMMALREMLTGMYKLFYD
jgi:serine/threonine protein kinase